MSDWCCRTCAFLSSNDDEAKYHDSLTGHFVMVHERYDPETTNATPTPPSPEPPREREGETWTRIHSLIDGAVTEGTMDDDDAQRFHREVNALVAASLPPSAETREPEYTLDPGSERWTFRWPKPSAPPAGSGETEDWTDDDEDAETLRAIAAYHSAALTLREIATLLRVADHLAAHPAGPTRAEEGECQTSESLADMMTEGERVAEYHALRRDGVSDSEARGTLWPPPAHYEDRMVLWHHPECRVYETGECRLECGYYNPPATPTTEEP